MNNAISKKYDIILVIEYFRSVTYYLNIIKYLSGDHKIGLFIVPMDNGLLAKNKNVQSQFIDLCIGLGGELVTEDQIETNILIVPQRPYIDRAVELILRIQAKKMVGILALAWAGIPEHDDFLQFFDIDVVFVVDMHLLRYLLKHRNGQEVYQGKKLIEVGLPFMHFPVFDGIFVDYMIAMPTGFSFPHESDKWLFMETVLSLLAKISKKEIVVLKSHNGMDRDQFSRPHHRWLASVFLLIPKFGAILSKLAESLKNTLLGNFIGQVYTSYLYEKVLKRTIPFSEQTDYYQISMEVFLPNIRKGVIGGLSNTMWGALFAKIPYYNCVDIAIQRRDSKDRLYGKKDPSNYLDLNLGYFNVPYCQGLLDFNSDYYQILADSTRNADMLKELRKLVRPE